MQHTHTREEIIDIADGLVRRRGYHGFSYAHIARTMDVQNAAIHYYFPAKEDLGKELIINEIKRIDDSRRDSGAAGGVGALMRLVQTFHELSRSDQVCLNGAFIPDYHYFTAALQKPVQEMAGGPPPWAA